MTFIAAGTALAAGVGLGSGALAVAAGTAVAAGAAGAALGATGAAVTGGDVGEGALMGGVSGMVGGGLGAGLGAAGMAGSMGANVAAGGIAGAAGGAAGSAAAGKDVGEGALMGGVMGGIGGAMKGVAPTEGVGEVSIPSNAPPGTPLTPTGAPVESALSAPLPAGQDIPISAPVGGPDMSGWKAPTIAYNAPAAGTGIVSAPPPSAFEKGMAAVSGLNGMDVAKTAAPMLIGGAINGQVEPEPYVKPKSNYVGGASLSKDFKPYWADPQLYYAEGGAVGPMQGQPMNKFAQMGLEMAQQQAAAQQANQQVAQQLAPQGIVQAAPQAQSAPVTGIGYAKGGLLNDLPGSDIMKSVYDSSIGNIIAPSLSEQMFGEDKPYEERKPSDQSDFMKQVEAGVQQQMQQQQDAQPQQPQQVLKPQQYQNPQNGIYSYANGGLTSGDNLGDYSHGGIAGLTRGPGDGVSDDIPAEIGASGKQPAKLADGEFVIPARAVSELGNGSTEAGAKSLQAMVDKVQARRSKTTGKGKVAVDSKARKELLA